MDSRRQLKIASVIQEAFTDILSREGKSLYGKAFVTLTKVKVTSDLSLARFYISIYNSVAPEAIIAKFEEHESDLKRKLAERLRLQLRIMPEIEFFRDETLDYAFRIEEVFKKIKEEDALIKEAAKAKPAAKAKTKSPARKKTK